MSTAAAAGALLVIVQARLSSSRLPGKVLLEVAGKSLLGHLLDRVRRSSYRPQVLVATTTAPADDRVEAEARRFGADVFRGSESDVLARFAGALERQPAHVVVRLTADNPLLDPHELDRVIGEFLAGMNGPDGLDYATNHTTSGGRPPLGLDVEVFRAEALERAHREATEAGDREHVTAYLYRVPGRFRVLRTPYPVPERSRFRLTVDTPADLELVRAVLTALGPDAELAEIAEYLAAHPEVAGLNAGVVQRSVESEGELRRRRIAGRYLVARADASATIGYGHVMRTGALLEAWTELGGRALFIGRGLTGSVAARLGAAGVQTEEPVGDGRVLEARLLLERARVLDAAALVVDGYTFDADYHAVLAHGGPLLAVDDLAEQAQHADVVVNQNVGFARESYALRAEQRLLVGAPYVMLRRALRGMIAERSAHGRASVNPRGSSLALAFGGSDPLGLTEPVLAALLESVPDVRVDVLLGPGVSAERRQRLSAVSNPRVTLHVDPPELGAVLARADVLISAAGVTVWEALALGVPTVLLCVAENQRVVAAPAIEQGAAVDAGWADAEAPQRAARVAGALLADGARRQTLSDAGRRLIDGRGVWRVIDTLLDAIDTRARRP